MSEEIIKVLNALAEKFGLAIDWTSVNVIPYLNQLCDKYVNYEIATSIVWMILGLLLYVAGIICYKILYKNKDLGVEHYAYSPDDAFLRGLMYSCVFTILVISLAVVISQIFDIVTCMTFPEKIIIDELKSIYTNMNG